MNNNENIILFDGSCGLCSKFANFIMRKDVNSKFKFASLLSDVAKNILQERNITYDPDAIIFLNGDKYYRASSAVLHIFKIIGGVWKLLYPLIIIPSFIRNKIYNLIAKNRYRVCSKF